MPCPVYPPCLPTQDEAANSVDTMEEDRDLDLALEDEQQQDPMEKFHRPGRTSARKRVAVPSDSDEDEA